jgi:hypothetical protein
LLRFCDGVQGQNLEFPKRGEFRFLPNTDNGCAERRIEERLKALRLQAAWGLPCRYRAALPSRAGFVRAWSGLEKAVCTRYLNRLGCC